MIQVFQVFKLEPSEPKDVGSGDDFDGDNNVGQNNDSFKNDNSQDKKVDFAENELDDMRLYLFLKNNPPGPNQVIDYEDIPENPLKPGQKKVLVSPYILMFECCLKRCGDPKYKKYYRMIKNCDKIIKTNLSIHYLIKKHFEVMSIKSLLMARYPFKCQFDSIDVNNPYPNQSIMDEYDHEYKRLVLKNKDDDSKTSSENNGESSSRKNDDNKDGEENKPETSKDRKEREEDEQNQAKQDEILLKIRMIQEKEKNEENNHKTEEIQEKHIEKNVEKVEAKKKFNFIKKKEEK